MSPIPSECQPIADKILELKEERADLQAELHTGLSGAQKAAVVKEIKKLNDAIEEREKDFQECMGEEPSPPRLTCTLSGTMTIRTANPQFPGPFDRPVTLTLTFSGPNRTNVELFFPSVSLGDFKIIGPLGVECINTVTIHLPGGTAMGRFNASLGDIDIPLTLMVSNAISGGAHCLPLGLAAGPSTASLTPPGLTTRTVPSPLSATGTLFGSPLNRTPGPNLGRVTLVGAGVAAGGLLFNGVVCDMTISGRFAQPCPI